MEQEIESTYNVLIVEDELMIASHIAECLEAENFNCKGIAKSYGETLVYLEKDDEIDFIILDINLFGEKTGIDLAQKINETYHIPFFYLTSYSDRETLTELKKTDPLGYLSKPINEIELVTALQIAAKNIEKNVFSLRIGTKSYSINLNALCYIKSDHVYVDVVTLDDRLTLRISLSNMEKLLPDKTVVKANRSLLVNPKCVKKIENNTLHIGRKTFTISNSCRANFL